MATGNGTAQENGDHPSAQLGQLAEVAAQQHDEDHGVQQIVLQRGIGRRTGVGSIHAHGTKYHVEHVDPHKGRDNVKDSPLGVLLQSQKPPARNIKKAM